MAARWIVAAVVAVGLCGCGPSPDGRVAMDVGVASLTAVQHFCFTWRLYQLSGHRWRPVDAQELPLCADDGVDSSSSYGACFDGHPFLVAYTVTFYEADVAVRTAAGASGGGQDDLCELGRDVPTSVLFQFGNEGGVALAGVGASVAPSGEDFLLSAEPPAEAAPAGSAGSGQFR